MGTGNQAPGDVRTADGVAALARREQIEHLFERAADLTAVECEELLTRECGGDQALADEVRSLLASDDDGRRLGAGARPRWTGTPPGDPDPLVS